jgi:hypothetical protein
MAITGCFKSCGFRVILFVYEIVGIDGNIQDTNHIIEQLSIDRRYCP